MWLVLCLYMFGLLSAARKSDYIYYNIGAQSRENVVQPFSFHVPGSVYNIPSPVAAPPRTPASTVLLPMVGQPSTGASGGDISQGGGISATPYIKPYDKCAKFFNLCTGIDIYDIYHPKIKSYSMTEGVTPTFLQHVHGFPYHMALQSALPVTHADQYPDPEPPQPVAHGAQYPGHGSSQPVPTPYIGGRFWCGIYAWNCVPDMKKIKDHIKKNPNLYPGLLPIVG